ncbi:hypothetical protein JR316_0001566 [Psilocybe cubensis]|uniref:Uncharacterized protein n=2 Tax=Psilocybe cubensis TaxID=181762 RepID=A0ACB8HAG6_PSICU|nr:hypothetical protein JR316_0001566 [Psilocybe cubensis]KAH9484667.1 hypothetical protein JR316_0001566 [Psilocybe cubensis]
MQNTENLNVDIGTQLNSTLVQCFLSGVYMVIYGGTLYFYLSKKQQSKAHRAVLAAITALYAFSLINLVVQWTGSNSTVVYSSGTRVSLSQASLNIPQRIRLMIGTTLAVSILISDVLLIWRCYSIWGNSLKVAMIPLVLLAIEIVIAIASTVIVCLHPKITDAPADSKIDYVAATGLLFSLCTNLYTTSLIGYRIYTTTRDISISHNRGRYMRIFFVLVETSAMYIFVLVVVAICQFVPQVSEQTYPLVGLNAYATVAQSILGLIPTAMVLRLVLTGICTAS